jgi:ABC-type dipeptide/oligopeptide/nickel transport system ATPase component
VSFTVERGECFGLVGESGSGKSMTLRSILGLVPRPAGVTAGEVHHDGSDLTTAVAFATWPRSAAAPSPPSCRTPCRP